MLVELTKEEIAVITRLLGETIGDVCVENFYDLTYLMYQKFSEIADKNIVNKITCDSVQNIHGDLR